MDTFRRIRNVDTFGHTVTSNRTRLGELDTFEGKDTFLSVLYVLFLKRHTGTHVNVRKLYVDGWCTN